MRTDFEYAVELDRQDELAHFRDEFVIDDPEVSISMEIRWVDCQSGARRESVSLLSGNGEGD